MRNRSLGTVSITQAERFLCDWANLPGPWPLAKMDPKSLAKFADAQKRIKRRYGKVFGDPVGHPWLRDMLRRAWDTTDEREREWLCFRMRDSYAAMVRHQSMSIEEIREEEAAIDDVGSPHYAAPPLTPLEAALFHFQHQAKRARRCQNPECPASYFFASKKSQKFCDTPCTLPARRESKRIWWQNNRAK
jgi:hypothetical protein